MGVGLLLSYEHNGWAGTQCQGGCTCEPGEWSTLHDAHVRPGPACLREGGRVCPQLPRVTHALVATLGVLRRCRKRSGCGLAQSWKRGSSASSWCDVDAPPACPRVAGAGPGASRHPYASCAPPTYPPPPAPPPLQTHAQVTNLNRTDDPGGEHKVKVTGLTVAEGVKDTAQFGMFGAWGMTFDFWKHDP